MSTRVNYSYSHTIGMLSVTGRGFNNPVDLAIGENDVLYVLNRAGSDVAERMLSKRISICTVGEDYLGEFGSGGSKNGEMMWPCSIAISGEGTIYVSDEALHRISIFDRKGNFLGKWGAEGSGEGEFRRPAGIAFDKENNLLVVDGMNNRVQRYTKDGRFLDGWGRSGNGNGEFNVPWGITTDDEENVYVADWRNDRVQKFDADGRHIATIGASGGDDGAFHRPSGVTVDREGNIYVADWGNHRVQILDREGRFLSKFRGESGVSKWGDEYFEANLDELEERRKADMEPELDLRPGDDIREESASIEKYFWGPTSVKLDNRGRMLVVDSCRARIQVFERDNTAE